MYTRLIIVVLIVAAVVVSTATAQTTVNTTAPLNTTTTAQPSATGVTSSVTTIAPSNTTTAAPSGSTGSSNTTAAPSGSTGSSNTTASNATTTAQSPTTTAIPVGALTTSISKAGCGTQQSCLSQPTSCDPSTSGSCYFISSQQLSGQNYQLGLSGSSPGYIAVALSTSTVGSNDTTYICANNNSVVQFFVAYFNGNMLTKTSSASVSSVKGSAIGNTIQCIFNATLPAGSTKALKFQVAFLTGNYTNGMLGNATVIFQKSADLSSITSHAITFKQSLTQAVLIVMVALRLTM